jgi:hypothetical protein
VALLRWAVRSTLTEQQALDATAAPAGYRRRVARTPDVSPYDVFAAPDVPDCLSILVMRQRGVYTGTVRWSWWPRAYAVELVDKMGFVVGSRTTHHAPSREVARTFELVPPRRPTPGVLLRAIAAAAWRMGQAREPEPPAPWWQPPLPGL